MSVSDLGLASASEGGRDETVREGQVTENDRLRIALAYKGGGGGGTQERGRWSGTLSTSVLLLHAREVAVAACVCVGEEACMGCGGGGTPPTRSCT